MRRAAYGVGKAVKVQTTGKDRYGRTLGRVFVGETDVNVHLVRQGLAWWYRKYSDDPKLKAAEEAARRARRGLWADPSPVPPWDWRKEHSEGGDKTPPSATGGQRAGCPPSSGRTTETTPWSG